MAHDFLLQEYARKLRKSATEEENLRWYQFLRTYPIQFRRQKVIGRYIVDFFCSEARLVVEVDGGQHFEDSGRISDAERTEYLEQIRGFQVLRFTNLEIKYQFTEVCSVIDRKVQQNVPSSVSLRSTASPQGEALGEHLPLGGRCPRRRRMRVLFGTAIRISTGDRKGLPCKGVRTCEKLRNLGRPSVTRLRKSRNVSGCAASLSRT